jgi:hypothetical protein
MKALHYDPFAKLPRSECTVGALRAKAEHVDVTPKSYGGLSPLRAGESGKAVTSGDIIRMFKELM